ncbi:CesT family type III secretion system chaperone [Vibrio harveyi]|uniref:CesT family type III secretion system chaperone n=1 Tax=Vibrio harveyi TaxID=669 RepID=UPI00234E2FC6|nr:CesT family type III secretion system chaperone [Vibrio harveyi]WCP80306.1 CesT family type III secretion system chaperone [Vibrio harveyi]
MNTLQVLLKEFCEINELPPLSFSEENRCQLLVDDRYVIYFSATEQNDLILSVAFGGLEKSGELRLKGLELLAHANYFGIADGSLTLSLAPNGRQLVLAGRKPIEHLNAASLSTWFHALNEQTQLWQARFVMLDQDPTQFINQEQSHVQTLRV